ncbi:MAG: class I SAM-dependent methyltransferase [Candidatus Margulisbacteria bacterium]|nr:class I SAM-dependent methyltransferase [Candidatus Margulisiibacteriota bacterium]
MYQNFSDIYDELFPVSEAQKTFFINLATNITEPKNLLEIGCGTGELAIALDKHFNYIAAIDLDRSMIEKAVSKQHSHHLDFKQMNMTHIDNFFFNHSFSVLSCLGNTLVHLPSSLDIQMFISGCHQLLRKNGKLVLQILNYEKIFAQNITLLKNIETDNFLFERQYDLLNNEKVIFRTIVTSKKTKEEKISETSLYPIRPQNLLTLLHDCGFNNIVTYGSFNKENFTSDSDVLVIEATT